MSNRCQQLAAQLCHCVTACFFFFATGCEMNMKVNCAHSPFLSGWVMSLGLQWWVTSFLRKGKLQTLDGLFVGAAPLRWGRRCYEKMNRRCTFIPRVKVTLHRHDEWLPTVGRAVDRSQPQTLLLVIGADRTLLLPAAWSLTLEWPTTTQKRWCDITGKEPR